MLTYVLFDVSSLLVKSCGIKQSKERNKYFMSTEQTRVETEICVIWFRYFLTRIYKLFGANVTIDFF